MIAAIAGAAAGATAAIENTGNKPKRRKFQVTFTRAELELLRYRLEIQAEAYQKEMNIAEAGMPDDIAIECRRDKRMGQLLFNKIVDILYTNGGQK
jgi:hypothetical protein